MRQDLAALLGAARQRLRRRLGDRRRPARPHRIQEGGRSGAHGLAVDGTRCKNLSGKAFRFGIFWRPILIRQTPAIAPCFATEIRPVRLPCGPVARQASGCKQMLSCGPSLGKVAAVGAISRKVFPYYDTNLWTSTVCAGAWRPAIALLWGRSHMQSGHCRNCEEFCLPIEPSATPIRPTLRDGH